MTEGLWSYELPLNRRKAKFALHNKRASLGNETKTDSNPVLFAKTNNRQTDFLPSIKGNPNTLREGYSMKFSTARLQLAQTSEQPPLKFPMTTSIALKTCTHFLTPFEQNEVLAYSLIYYLGNPEKRLGLNMGAKNFGFDEENGNYKLLVNDHLAYRYEVLELIGKGSFGQVVKCLDHKSKQLCAIKIIKNKRRFHKQSVYELKILRYINSHDYNDSANAVHLLEHFQFRAHVCLKFDLLYCNLFEMCKKSNYQGVALSLIKLYTVQIAACLVFLRKHSIIHCDLKPENILLSSRGTSCIKIIDFGSACFTDERLYTYIQSRFYRAPEVILGIPYNCAIDVWSFGLILAELFLGYPLFPGEDEHEQLAYMLQYLNFPPQSLLSKATRLEEFFNERDELIVSKGKHRVPGSKRITEKFKGADPKFVELVEGKD